MNPDPEKQDELQRILSLKRHETPPSRFFKSFSGDVLDRLHSPEPTAHETWWQRLGLDSKPVLVCASGVAVCVLLMAGLLASLRVDPPKPVPPAPDDQTHLVVAPPPNAAAAPAAQASPIPSIEQVPSIGDPVVVSESSPFNKVKPRANQTALKTQPAAGSPGAK